MNEYRRVLLAWAVDNMPPDLPMSRIIDVDVNYSAGLRGYSEWTPGESPQFTIKVRYEDDTGRKQRWTTNDPVSMATLLQQLFRLADLTAQELTAEQADRKAERDRQAALKRERDEWVRRCDEEALVALFAGEQQVTDWQPKASGKVTIPAGWTGKITTLGVTLHDGTVARIPYEVDITDPWFPKLIHLEP
jgi:hypothetical protein